MKTMTIRYIFDTLSGVSIAYDQLPNSDRVRAVWAILGKNEVFDKNHAKMILENRFSTKDQKYGFEYQMLEWSGLSLNGLYATIIEISKHYINSKNIKYVNAGNKLKEFIYNKCRVKIDLQRMHDEYYETGYSETVAAVERSKNSMKNVEHQYGDDLNITFNHFIPDGLCIGYIVKDCEIEYAVAFCNEDNYDRRVARSIINKRFNRGDTVVLIHNGGDALVEISMNIISKIFNGEHHPGIPDSIHKDNEIKIELLKNHNRIVLRAESRKHKF